MYDTITTAELAQKLQAGQPELLDVREPDEFAAGHIPEARNLPLSQLVAAQDTLDPSQHYYLICRSGNRSANACAYLSQKGFQVTNVAGGMLDWKGAVSQ